MSEGLHIRGQRPPWSDICPEGYRDTVSEKIPNKTAMKEVLAWKLNPKGLFLAGPTDEGKTRSMWLLARRLYDEGVNVRVIASLDFAKSVSGLFSFSPQEGAEFVKRLSFPKVLCFDDLGQERCTERVESELFWVVEERMKLRKPVVFTSNIAEDLVKRFSEERGQALVRRIQESTTIIPF